MKIKFRIRSILLLMLVLAIAVICTRWVQQERLKNDDALEAKFTEIGVEEGDGAFAILPPWYTHEKTNPTLQERLFGKTKNAFPSPQFGAIDLDADTACFFARSDAAQEITAIAFDQTNISPEACCFLSNWKSLSWVWFDGVAIPKSWPKEIILHRNIEFMAIFKSTGFSLEDLKQMKQLKFLVLLKEEFEAQEQEAIIQALPNTLVKFG